ncbi:MAG: TolC family protein [bacterium]
MRARFSSFHRILLCGLLWTCGVPTLAAQQVLTLQEALQRARRNNLQIRQQGENARMAQLQELVQKSRRLPALDLSVNSVYFSEVNEIDLSRTIEFVDRKVQLGGHERSELLLSVRQPVFTGFRLQSQVELAKNATSSEQARIDLLSNEVYHQVYLLFYQSQNLFNQKLLLQASLDRLHIQLQNVRNLFAAAQVMAFDTLRVYNQTLAVNIDLEKTGLAARLTRLQMALLLDLQPPVQIAKIDLPRPEAPPYELQPLLNEAHSKRPELAGVRLALRGASIQRKLARAAYLPTVFAAGTLHYARPGLDPVANNWMDYFSVGIDLRWNLWRWRADRRSVEKLDVLANRLSLQERELVQRIEFQVKESVEKLNFSLQQLDLAEELQAQQAERYRIVSMQHQNGVASTNDLISAETDLTRTELQTQQALVQYYIYLCDLKKAVGSIAEF